MPKESKDEEVSPPRKETRGRPRINHKGRARTRAFQDEKDAEAEDGKSKKQKRGRQDAHATQVGARPSRCSCYAGASHEQ